MFILPLLYLLELLFGGKSVCACGGGVLRNFCYLISAERMRGFISLHLVLTLSLYSQGLALYLSVCRETLQNSLRGDGVGFN